MNFESLIGINGSMNFGMTFNDENILSPLDFFNPKFLKVYLCKESPMFLTPDIDIKDYIMDSDKISKVMELTGEFVLLDEMKKNRSDYESVIEEFSPQYLDTYYAIEDNVESKHSNIMPNLFVIDELEWYSNLNAKDKKEVMKYLGMTLKRTFNIYPDFIICDVSVNNNDIFDMDDFLDKIPDDILNAKNLNEFDKGFMDALLEGDLGGFKNQMINKLSDKVKMNDSDVPLDGFNIKPQKKSESIKKENGAIIPFKPNNKPELKLISDRNEELFNSLKQVGFKVFKDTNIMYYKVSDYWNIRK